MMAALTETASDAMSRLQPRTDSLAGWYPCSTAWA